VAQKVEVTLIDDLDGSKAAHTVTLGYEGVGYELDLSAKNAQKLGDFLAPYIGVARKLGKLGGTRKAGRPPGGAAAIADREQNQAIREWAKKKGIHVSERGRIPEAVREQYNAEA
jgi:hypothetical protein